MRTSAFLIVFLLSSLSWGSSQGIILPLTGDFEVGDGLGAPRDGHRHQGVDLGANTGTPIVAIWDGVVVKASGGGNAGWAVRIEHPNGLVSFYAHMKSKPSVGTGDVVAQGTVLGYVGETGNATFPHLHFEIREGNKVLDPADFYRGM